MWPKKAEYQQAVQNPYGSFEDVELQTANPVLDGTGVPRVLSGGSAAVFLLKCPSRKIAVRCFLTQTTDRQARFTQISDELLGIHVQPHCPVPNTTNFEYIQKGIRVKGNWYPILKMDWIEGNTLTEFVRDNCQESARLRLLAEKWVAMSRAWRKKQIAHGNLQPANVLITENEITLVDYDGVFCPSLDGRPAEELGSPDYQHPGRNLSHFGEYLDNFADWVIYTSLVAISVDQRFLKFVGYEESALIFRKADFLSPTESEVLFRMKGHGSEELKILGRQIERLLALHIQQVPPLEPEKIVPVRVSNPVPVTGPAPQTQQSGNPALRTSGFASGPSASGPSPPFASTIPSFSSTIPSASPESLPTPAAPPAVPDGNRPIHTGAPPADNRQRSDTMSAQGQDKLNPHSGPQEKPSITFGSPPESLSRSGRQPEVGYVPGRDSHKPEDALSSSDNGRLAGNRPRRHKDVLDLDDPEEAPIGRSPSHPAILDSNDRMAEQRGVESGVWIAPSLDKDAPVSDPSISSDNRRIPSRLRSMGLEEPVKPKSTSPLIFVVVFLVLAAGAGGAAFYMYKPPRATEIPSGPAVTSNPDTSSASVNDLTVTVKKDGTEGSGTIAGSGISTPVKNAGVGPEASSGKSGSAPAETTTATGATSTVKGNPQMAPTLCDEGQKFLQRKQYKSAISRFDLALKEDPAKAEAYGGRADSYMGLKWYGEALDDYTKALSLESDNKAFYKGRGWAYLSLEQYLKAIADYKKAISLDANDPVLYSDLGKCYGGLTQYQQAIDYFNQSIECKPLANTYYLRGGTYYSVLKYHEALADYKKAAALNPKDADAWYGIGSCYYCFKRYHDAKEPYQKALALYKANGNKAWTTKVEAFLKEVSATNN